MVGSTQRSVRKLRFMLIVNHEVIVMMVWATNIFTFLMESTENDVSVKMVNLFVCFYFYS